MCAQEIRHGIVQLSTQNYSWDFVVFGGGILTGRSVVRTRRLGQTGFVWAQGPQLEDGVAA